MKAHNEKPISHQGFNEAAAVRPRKRGVDWVRDAGAAEIGAAWRRTRKGSEETYLSIKLDDPALPQPIWGALLEATEDGTARLIWRRDRRDDG